MDLILPKSIFIHIPKTGGTWVRRAIEASMGIEKDSAEIEIYGIDHWGKTAHARLQDLKRELKESLEDRYLFSFVRKYKLSNNASEQEKIKLQIEKLIK